MRKISEFIIGKIGYQKGESCNVVDETPPKHLQNYGKTLKNIGCF